jgi:hypothetical protein
MARQESEELLLERFNNLSLLLTLTTAVNDFEKLPTFNRDLVMTERISRFRDKDTVLEAALAILVQDNEILAGMTYNRTSLALLTESDGSAGLKTGSNSNMELNADPDMEDEPGSNDREPLRFTAVANPDRERDKDWGSGPGGGYNLINLGTCNWNTIRNSNEDVFKFSKG